mmetsp:Transcript_49210/g.73357  ORF Transcript_49210/g.73357 Transcript_49210/m.73357 type:complete len:83 (+) Transcript_49210:326-574(+)
MENKEEAAIDAILSLKKSSTAAPKAPVESTNAAHNTSQGTQDKQQPTEQPNKKESDERTTNIAAAKDQNRPASGFYPSMRFN